MAATTPGSAEADDALPVVAAHPGWRATLSGYVQVDSIAWSQTSVDELDPSGQPLDEQRILIRRGRLRVEAERAAIFAAFELDGNTQGGPTARILGAQVGWRYRRSDAPAAPPLITATAGLIKIPFGVEVPASERDKPFLEPPTAARALFPGNYDGGAAIEGRYGLARWALAITNGAPVGDAQWKGKDPASSYDFVGRLGADVALPLDLRIVAGVSGLSGTGLHPGTPAIKDSIQWVDDNQNGRVDPTELQIIPGSPGEPSQTFSRSALGGDLQLHWVLDALGDGAAFFEIVAASNLDRGVVYSDPVSLSRDGRQLGITVGAVQRITEHARVGVRYDRYDADRDAHDREGVALVNVHKVFSTLAVNATAEWHDARVTVEYDHERNPFGRGDGGAPITRAADRVTLRAQVGF